jgi:alcohol dehydrogenase
MATNDGGYWDYISSGTGKGKAVSCRPLSIVAIPITAGTGSKMDAACVITNDKTNEKTGFGIPALFPVLAVIDAELMLTIPPSYTAYQGFDALFHSVECYISNKANEMSDMYALTAIKTIAANLPRVVHNGGDLKARVQISFGSTLSGAVMTISGCTSEHSLEHAMSAYHQNLPHGAGLILIAVAYYRYFIEHSCCDDRFIQMAKAMGQEKADKAEDFLLALKTLMEDCDVDTLQMTDFGISANEFHLMAENAQATMGRLFQNDRKQLTVADCVEIYQRSFAQDGGK